MRSFKYNSTFHLSCLKADKSTYTREKKIFYKVHEQNIGETAENKGSGTVDVAGIPCLFLGVP